MSFDESVILDVTARPTDADLLISWRSSAPAGSVYQVYVNRVLQWHGQQLSAVVPMPPPGPTKIDVGAVAAADELTDFSGSLPPGVDDRAELNWFGGTYLDADIAGFYVYQSVTPGGSLNTTTPAAIVPAYSQGSITDGFGMGGFGQGGFGLAASSYQWISAHLAPGVWQFGIAAFDQAGNVGSISTVSLTIVGPPLPPGRNARGERLTYSYNAVSRVATLTWLPPAA